MRLEGAIDELAEGAHFDTKPDPTDARFDLMEIRLPHGGTPRPAKRYEGKMAGFRLMRFCGVFVTGWAQQQGKRALAIQLTRWLKSVYREEDEWGKRVS